MKKQPWFVLIVLALAMLSCSVFSGADEQLSQDDAAIVPESTQDLRIESRQNSPTPKATEEEGPSGETPQVATDVPQADPTPTLDLDEAPWLREFDIQFTLIEGEFDLELLDATVIKVYESTYVYGVIQNQEEFPLFTPKIFIDVLDGEGHVLHSDFGFFSMPVLFPGDQANFELSLNRDEFPEQTEAIVFSTEMTTREETDYTRNLEIIEPEGDLRLSVFDGLYEYEIEGDIKNLTDRPIRIHAVAAALYDEYGNFLRSGSASVVVPSGGLPPGETAFFEIEIPYVRRAVDHFTIYAIGYGVGE